MGGPISGALMSGIGINLSSSILESGGLNVRERWLTGKDGILNHDIQKALGRAFTKALSSLETKYFSQEETRTLNPYERESIHELFREFREKAQALLLESINNIQLDAALKNYLFNAPGATGQNVWAWLVKDDLIVRYGSHFRDFVRQNLLDEMMVWFAEELKTDNRESNKAWRAFQRLLLEGIYADVQSVRAGQEAASHDLQKLDVLRGQLDQLSDVIDRRLPNELFQRDFELAVEEINTHLREIARRSQRIDDNVMRIRHDLSDLLNQRPAPESPEEIARQLSEIRRTMFAASPYELREASYKVDELLAKYPQHVEARMLRDNLQNALRYEQPQPCFAAAPQSYMHAEKVRFKAQKSRSWLLIPVLVFLLFLLYLLFRWLWGWS